MVAESSKAWNTYEKMCEILWAIGLIGLPLTSLPLLSSLAGAIVTPFSLIPFIILLVFWSFPLFLRRGKLPKETLPLAAFSLVAILSCAAAFFIFIPGFKGKTVPSQEIRALLTLAVGLTFYLVTTTWVSDLGKLKKTWKYLTIGGIISLAWTGVQAFYILRHVNEFPSWLVHIQFLLTVKSPAFSAKYGRVSGFTYEASWFAHQMVIIYLPIWIAATFHKTSAFKYRLLGLSAENILLVFGLGAFFLSSPRIGLVSLLLMLVYLFWRLNLVLHRSIVERILSLKRFTQPGSRPANKTLIHALTSLFIILVYFLTLTGVILFAIHRDYRLITLVNNPPTGKEIIGLLTLDENTLLELSHRFVFLERMVYWLNGWNVFNVFPWLGVGLGNAGFFFPQLAPSIGWASFEIRNVLYYLTQLPNVKALWFRLLAETGLVGFSLFITWLVILFQSSRLTQRHDNAMIKTFALAGQLALLAFIGEGFSIDSFAMPYLWVIAGLIAAVAMMYRKRNSENNSGGQ
jgi:hypothetical protein